MRVLALLALFAGVFWQLPAGAERDGRNTVFLVAMDGVRSDYIERSHTPFLDWAMGEGAWSLELAPTFPTNTFQSFSSLATGVRAREHGVTGNSFYDNRTRRTYRYPSDAGMLESEPIWQTAERQGVRTLVLDWVLAHNQTGPARTSHFESEYTRGLSDADRLARVMNAWRADSGNPPLQFILAYGESPDSEGHRYGPDSPRIDAAMARIDRLLEATYAEARKIWRATAGPEDSLYFVLLSDHGMSAVEHMVNLRRAADLDRRDAVVSVTVANVGHLFFDRLRSTERREQWLADARKALARHKFISVYERHELPAEWDYAHPHRTGDLVAVLPSGYTFSARPETAVERVVPGDGPLGMHGYDPVDDPNMNTLFVVHRYPNPLRTGDLGPISTLQVHPTIARILGVAPALGALADPVVLEREKVSPVD